MKKFSKKIIAGLLILGGLMAVNPFVLNASAEPQCCVDMHNVIVEEVDYGDRYTTTCQNSSHGHCVITCCKVYKVKKCTNCGNEVYRKSAGVKAYHSGLGQTP